VLKIYVLIVAEIHLWVLVFGLIVSVGMMAGSAEIVMSTLAVFVGKKSVI
jgi:hypothetical protein